MQILKNKIIASLLVFTLVFASALYPQRDSRAFAFLLLPGIEIIMNPGTAIGLAAVATAIGLTSWYLSLKKPDGTQGLTVKINPKAPEPVPAGWTPAADPANAPVPPSTSTPSGTTFSIAAGFGSGCPSGCNGPTFDNVCRAWLGAYAATPTLYSVNDDVTCAIFFDPSGSETAIVTSGPTCSPGYTYSGGTCTLTSPELVPYPVDNKCQVKMSGGTFQSDPRDPDCGGPSSPEYTVSPDSKVLTIDKDGNKSVITSNPDNTIKAEQWTSNGNGTSNYTGVAISAPDSSSPTGGASVTGYTTGTVPGQGSLAGSADDVGTKGAARCGAPGQPACRIDETGTPTGAGVADASKAALNSKSPSDFGILDWTGSGISIFSGLPTIAGSDSCVNPITWVWMGQTLNPDMCAIWGPIKSGFAWLLYAMTALYIWRRVTTAL